MRLWWRLRSRLLYRRVHVPPRSCPVCGLDVWWSTRRNRSKRGRVFCCAEHKDRAAHPKPRPRPTVGAMVPPVEPLDCPFPHKVEFASQDEAKQARSTLLAADGKLHAYRCPAGGHWHIGHPRVDDGQRVVAIARVSTGVRPRIVCQCGKETSVTERGNIHAHRRGDGEAGRCPLSGTPAAELSA